MYKSTKNEDGTYSKLAFIRRGKRLTSIALFKKKCHIFYPEAGICKRFVLLLDFYLCLFRYGAVVNDYFEYRFWEKKHILRKKYVTMKMNIKVKRFFNHEPEGVFRNKILFNERFAEYRNLHCFDFRKSGEFSDFLKFVDDCQGNIIAKPLTGHSGLGIHKPDVFSEEKARKVYEELKKSGEFFCEEMFIQDGVIHQICPSSCNTVRIYTCHDGRNVHIMETLIRFGGGKGMVDNIHSGGMICVVEKESGVVITPGFNLSGDVFIRHPFSKVVLPGVQIPNWTEVLEKVEAAAGLYPQQGYVAWDIAVSENKVSIIEGNDGGNFDAIQVPLQKGVKAEYEYVMKLRKNNKQNSKI